MRRKKKNKRKNKSWTNKDKIYSILTVGIIFTSLFLIIRNNVKNRKEQLENNSFLTYGTIEKFRPNVSKGKSTRQDVVYFYFVKNDTVFHKLKHLTLGGIERLKLNMNESFEMKVVESDYGIFEIDFKKRKDTIINKRNFKTHKYNTFIHQNIIE